MSDDYEGPSKPIGGARRDDEDYTTPEDAPLDLQCAHEPLNELGNAKRLRRRFGAYLRSTLERGWGVWDGTRWNFKDGAGRAAKMAHRVAASILNEVRALENDGGSVKRVQALFVWSNKSATNGRMKSSLEIAAPYLRADLEDFDARPELLNTPGGTLELGQAGSPIDLVSMRPHNRGDLLTRCTETVFVEDARAPKFEAFLEQIMPNYELRQFMQRFFGYAITGDNGEQIMLLCYGRGANGKSVLLNILRKILGDYTLTLPFASLTGESQRGGGDPTPDLVRLPGSRLVTASEPKVGSRLDEGIIKGLTGGEPIQVRPLYGEPFEFTPTHKIVLSFNNKPKIIAQDEGTWRRIAMLPFEVTIPEADRDPDLADKIFETEASGVLNWLLDGVRMYREQGLSVPSRVIEATNEYRGDSDPVGPFIDEALERVPGRSVQASVVFAAYGVWCKLNNIEPVHRNRFGRIMTERGFEKAKASVYSYVGVDLTDRYRALLDGDENDPDKWRKKAEDDEPPI